jgi:hypothetical protein
MNFDPIEIALREITDTKRLVERLLTRSESFDYVGAKATLVELRLKLKALSRAQAELIALRSPPPEYIIPFPTARDVVR